VAHPELYAFNYQLSSRWKALSSTRWLRLRLRRQISSAFGDSLVSSSDKPIHTAGRRRISY
jgi:hypothetical protein